MERVPVYFDINDFPYVFHPLIKDAQLFDSSCSPEARVFYLEKDMGYFLKRAPKGKLEREAMMTEYFHKKGLGAEVLAYERQEFDWLLTRRVPGEDCICKMYLDDPKRLCDTTAVFLRNLHETEHSECPIQDHTKLYLATAKQNYQAGSFDTHLFTPEWSFSSAEEAWAFLQQHQHLLKNDTLLHGDYCLPNIILHNSADWRFSGFIDLGNGGVGDRHVDLFWGVWTLFFNLRTHAYRDRFLDAYGRDACQPELLRVVAAAECFG